MIDITEVAKKCGAALVTTEQGSVLATATFFKYELQAFADHYRKEGAEEANNTIEELRTRLSGQTCYVPPEFQAKMDELRQQLAATELVVEQMREALNVARSYMPSKYMPQGEVPCSHRLQVDEALQLQPSLSALREHEAKVLEEVASTFSGTSMLSEARIQVKLRLMASELRAKGD